MPAAMLTEVVVEDRGTSATTDVSAGGSVVSVEDTTQFDEDGGFLDICGVVYEYVSVDEDASEITLSGTLSADVDEFDPVLVVAGGEVARDWTAVCDLGAGDTVSVPIPYNLRAQLPEGLYEPAAPIILSADLTQILEVPGRAPVFDGQYIEPGTVPTDGEPPSESPQPVVLGAIGALAVKWEPVDNKDVVTYEVHISTVDDFTPDGTTLSTEETGTQHYIRKMPNGDALAYGTTYYVKLIAKDKDGAADPGDQGSGQMVKADTPDIAVNAITADQIVANAITTEKIAADAVTADELSADAIDGRVITGSTLRTAASGERVEVQVIGVDNPSGQISMFTGESNEFGPAAAFANGSVSGDFTILTLSLYSPMAKDDLDAFQIERASIEMTTGFDHVLQQATSVMQLKANTVIIAEPDGGGSSQVAVYPDTTFHGDVSIPGVTDAWSTYTPTLTATTTNPGLGTSPTAIGRYRVVGKTIDVMVELVFGTSPSAGSGTYLIGLPVAARATTPAHVGTGLVFQGSTRKTVVAELNTTSNVLMVTGDAGAVVTNSTFTWAAGGTLRLSLRYEAA